MSEAGLARAARVAMAMDYGPINCSTCRYRPDGVESYGVRQKFSSECYDRALAMGYQPGYDRDEVWLQRESYPCWEPDND